MPRKHSDNKKDLRKQVVAILPRLRAKKDSTRINAIRDLSSLGVGAAFAADSLLPFVTDPDDTIRSEAMKALAAIGFGSSKVSKSVRGLLAGFQPSDDPYTKCRVFWILEHIET